MDSSKYPLKRRTVLQSVGALSAAGLIGVPAFTSGIASASNHITHKFYAVHPYKGYVGGKRYLIGFDLPTSGTSIPASDVELDTTYIGGNVIGTLAFADDGTLYAVDLIAGQLFTINPTYGAVSFIGSPNADLEAVPGSGILPGDYLYGVKKSSNELVKVDLTDGTTDDTFDLTVDDSWDTVTSGTALSTIYGDYHIGLAVDFDSEDLIGIIGNGQNPYGSKKDELVKISTSGSVSLIEKDVVAELTRIGAEYEPCSGQLYATRGGSEFWRIDETGDNSQQIGSVTLDRSNVNVASLASPYPETVCCQDCEFEGTAKFEFMYDEDEGLNGFYLEDADEFDEIDYLSYDSKGGEMYEPVSVTFESDICPGDLIATVKGGRVTEEVTVQEGDHDGSIKVSIEGNDAFVNDKNGKSYAISYVEFACVEQNLAD